MKEQKLKIVYSFTPRLRSKGFKISDILDKEIEKLVKKLGYKFEGSGFNFKSWKRDLSFYRVINEI